jgi:hypothetical protein
MGKERRNIPMPNSEFPRDPRRLVHQGGPIGRLLESSELGFRSGLSEAASWRRLEARLDRRRRRPPIHYLAVACAACAFALFAFGSFRGRRATVSLPLSAEPVSSLVARFEPERVPAGLASAEPSLPSKAVPGALHRPPPARSPASDPGCSELADEQSFERAVDCYRGLAGGGDIRADVSLYEAARLSAGALHDPARALDFVDQYQLRFPGGAMRGEIAWLRVQSLERLGRVDDALAESEALLGTPLGRALSPKLHLLRGRIFAEQRGDCGRALSEYVSLVGEPGVEADSAELARANCLVRLGRDGEARTAYEQYLKRPDARGRPGAEQSLSALAATQQQTGQSP